MTFGVIVGIAGFFRITWPRPAAKKLFLCLKRAGMRAIVLRTRRAKYGAVETTRRLAALRGAFQKARGRDRRHHCHSAQFRRRAWHRGRHPSVGAESSGAGAGHSRPVRKMTIATPSRQFLRKDVACNNMMQYRHSTYSLTTLHTESPDFGDNSRQTWSGSLPSAASFKRVEESSHRRDRRAPHGIQYRALFGANLRNQRDHDRERWIFLKSSAALAA